MDEKSDEFLCQASQNGDGSAEEILIHRYYYLVRRCARPFFLLGGDGEDLIQEGMFGLLSAIRHYDTQKPAGFSTYAERCIHNSLVTVVRASQNEGSQPLNHSLPLDNLFPDSLSVFGAAVDVDPENLVLDREAVLELKHSVNCLLSKMENRVLKLYLMGMSYSQIAEKLNQTEKSVDNAVQRIRRKIGRKITSGDFSTC